MYIRMLSAAYRTVKAPRRLRLLSRPPTTHGKGGMAPPGRGGSPNEIRRFFAAKVKGRGAASSKAAATQAAGKGGEGVTKKQLALTMALKQVEMAYGKGAVMQLGSREVAKIEVIQTGSISLDHALGVGGLPKGRVVEVYGPESSGKTTVALHCVAECQKMGGTAVFIDAEHALDSAYAGAIGVDMSNLYLAQPDNGEQALDIVDTLVKSAAVDIVVVDSVAALVPKAELEGEMGDRHIALQARLMSQALRKLTAILSTTNCTLVFINQIRQKVGVVFGSPDITSGGMALRFYASVRLEVRKGQAIKRNGEIVGTKVKVKVAKNKLAPPFGKAEVDLMYGKGFDHYGELLDLGCELGLLNKSGAWFGVTGTLGVEKTELFGQLAPWLMGQGREKAKAFLSANPQLAKKLQETLSDKLAQGKEDITVETGDVPADPPSLAASSENLFEAKGTVSVEAEIVEPGGGSIVSIGGDDTSPSSGGTSFIRPLTKSVGEMGGKGEEGEILLEPGVSSVEELFRSDVLAKGGGKAGQAQQKKNADETHHQ